MKYDKEKIKRLTILKDELINEQQREDLQWIIQEYNQFYIDTREATRLKTKYLILQKTYYDLADQKFKIEEKLSMAKEKYHKLYCKYKILQDGCKK